MLTGVDGVPGTSCCPTSGTARAWPGTKAVENPESALTSIDGAETVKFVLASGNAEHVVHRVDHREAVVLPLARVGLP
jgi:hypothetical protein